jgi:DNA-directed RNA polymerase I, II, and III subunit RPABC2
MSEEIVEEPYSDNESINDDDLVEKEEEDNIEEESEYDDEVDELEEEFVEEDNEEEDTNDSFIDNNFTQKNYIKDISDLETENSQEFLEKFDLEFKNDYIKKFHSECLGKNFEEIKMLSKITRDSENNIIDKFHTTIPILTKFEKTKILGIRVKQLNNGSKPFINIDESILDNFIIAIKELEEKKLPFIIQRPLPNNTFEYWNISDLEII